MKVNMNIMKKSMTGAFLALAAVSTGNIEPMEACTRAVYIGPEQMVITGRTMDWKEDIMSNIYVFPRGMKRAGYNKGETVNWTSKYGSVIATGYDIGTCDGINEKGLVSPFVSTRRARIMLFSVLSQCKKRQSQTTRTPAAISRSQPRRVIVQPPHLQALRQGAHRAAGRHGR